MPQTGVAEPSVIDYPEKDERVTSPHYSIRAGARQDVDKVEISIDGSPWLSCRPAAGYWWYDWSGYISGGHEVKCRAHRGGNVILSAARRFRVELDGARLPKPGRRTRRQAKRVLV